ncbi:Signal recognition particle receptor subunit alpha -like protein [Ceratocystis fimbriata CBS 114723]|uniref:Signal recognition particle receptor subunit alpha homolog n=1 Tax=Ceratocystis fimbriata CBS 114723 TaxID=1035309 RepID=A0A2C5X3C5_9PEZI|nr:Signal recognition particle receptor subunit alpha -like protein [Ceratocystis fimbriata CBS 114723]
MLESFEIVTTAGVVLWSRAFNKTSPSIVNSFITDVFIEDKIPGAKTDTGSAKTNMAYKTDHHTIKWTLVKELGVIFVAVYRSVIHLPWVDSLVDNISTIFVSLYEDKLKRPNTTIVNCASFEKYFDQQLDELEQVAGPAAHTPATGTPLAFDEFSADDSMPSRPTTPMITNTTSSTAIAGPGGKLSRRQRKAQAQSAVQSGNESSSSTRKTKTAVSAKDTKKKGRKWDADGIATEDDDVQLDYSAPGDSSALEARGPSANLENPDASTWGTTTAKGQFVLRDLGDEVHDILALAKSKKSEKAEAAADAQAGARKGGLVGTGLSTLGDMFRNVVGGKTLTKEDLEKAMKGMEEHLLKKNVAREAALRLCEGVEKELVGVKTSTWESTQDRIKLAMEASLTKMLTPTSSLDLLREINNVTAPGMTSLAKPRPYVISIVGVNGVGKSTNLSKICYFLLQNRYKVLIAAGDTFRSGAVEQLAVHVRNLQELTLREGGQVALYQKGYGKDAAAVAKDAVAFAAQEGFDVVLIDTAGRRHNDQRLMSSLEKFAKFANPDKILMVGEALVGTDSVAQARNFNASFGAARSLDGFIISKCDTVGDMVGTLVSLIHATNVPVLFVGVGQHYSDLRNFSVKWAVEKLLTAN